MDQRHAVEIDSDYDDAHTSLGSIGQTDLSDWSTISVGAINHAHTAYSPQLGVMTISLPKDFS